MSTSCLVITSIAPATDAVRAFADLDDWDVLVVGDLKSPTDWTSPGVTYLAPADQAAVSRALPAALPWNHYCRKNVGYLAAMARGATRIAETDDDNFPLDGFLSDLAESVDALAWGGSRWVNVYRFFTRELVWPRGYPLELVRDSLQAHIRSVPGRYRCSVQQFLANDDPDVDAVYRLTVGKDDHRFASGTVVLAEGSFTPFNSQSTLWYPTAFPLLYLPSHVSFRMTDIWRSFIAQACLHAQGEHLAYHGPGVRQDRNAHDLVRDFRDEVPGYLANAQIVDLLAGLDLVKGQGTAGVNLRRCYEALVAAGHVPADELPLVEAWLADLADIRASTASSGGATPV